MVRLLPGVSPVAGVRYFVTGILATLRDDPQSLTRATDCHDQALANQARTQIQDPERTNQIVWAQFRPIQKQRAHY